MNKLEGHISYIEKDYNEYKLQSNKQSVEEILTKRGVKTTIDLLYDRGLFDNFDVLKEYSLAERRTPDLDH